MRELFVDTAYWVAQFDERDQLHQKALEIQAQFTDLRLVTSELVLTEFLNYFSKGGRRTRAEVGGVVRDILADASIRTIWQTQPLFELGLTLFEARLDKGYSLTDCVSMVMMSQSRIQDVLTHDRHFAQEGFNILL
jgi:uncharacterized protein